MSSNFFGYELSNVDKYFLCVWKIIQGTYVFDIPKKNPLVIVFSMVLPAVEDEEDEVMASGWGEVDNSAFRDDVMVEWGSLLERWDGRDKSRPKQLIKLCRQVMVMLNCVDICLCMCLFVCVCLYRPPVGSSPTPTEFACTESYM